MTFIEEMIEAIERIKNTPLPEWWWEYENEVMERIKNGKIRSRKEMDELLVEIAAKAR